MTFKKTVELAVFKEPKIKKAPLKTFGSALGLFFGLVACAPLAMAEGSADLIKRGKGFRAALLAYDPALGILPPDGRKTTSLHFAYAQAGEVINLSSSAQGVGQGGIVYRDPTGMSGRCEANRGKIANLQAEKAGAAAGQPCEITVADGQDGVWEIEFLPPTSSGDLTTYKPVGGRDNWQPQTATDFWVTAWDVSISNASLSKGGSVVPGRTFVRNLNAIVGPKGKNDTAWNSIWFGRSSEGFIYALDTNGIQSDTISLFGTSRGLKDEAGNSLYASTRLDQLGKTAFVADPYALGDPAGEQSLKLFFNRPDPGQPASAVSALMGEEWLNVEPLQGQALGSLAYDADSNSLNINVEGQGISNALELFPAGPIDTSTKVLHTYNNIASGTSSLPLPEGVGGEVIARFASKLAEIHFPFADLKANPSGIRIRRMNGPSANAGNVSWNLEETPSRFDGGLASTANSLREQAAPWGIDLGAGRLNDVWAMSAVYAMQPLSLPAMEADLGIVASLQSIKNNDDHSAQIAEVFVVLSNAGPEHSGSYGLDIAANSGVEITSVPGAVLNAEGKITGLNSLEAGESQKIQLFLTVSDTTAPLSFSLIEREVADPSAENDLAAVTFPELVAPEPEPEPEPTPEPVAEVVVETTPEVPETAFATAEAPALIEDTTAVNVEVVSTDAATEVTIVSEAAETTDVSVTTEPQALTVLGELTTDLIALRKRGDSDQAEVDLIFEVKNAGTAPLEDMSLTVAAARHLGSAFVSVVGKPMIEMLPQLPGSKVELNPDFTGYPGADQVLAKGANLMPQDVVTLRMTVHYDPDAVEAIGPLSIRGDLYSWFEGEEQRFPSDNDLQARSRDDDGDGNPINDASPLPGLRLIKSVKMMPGKVQDAPSPDLYDAIFNFELTNTGAMKLEDIAMADLFLENEAVTEIIDVTIQSVETESESFTATSLPKTFVGVNSVQRFEGGAATLLPGESVLVTAQVVFRLDAGALGTPVLNRAAAFGRVDLDGDGRLDTVIGDPADTDTTVGLDADGDGEEGNDATEVGFALLAASSLIAGEVKTNGGKSVVMLTLDATVANTGTADLDDVEVLVPLPKSLAAAFLDIEKAPEITLAPTLGSEAKALKAYDVKGSIDVLQKMKVLKAGEEFGFSTSYLFNIDGLNAEDLLQLVPSVRGSIDRDRDGLGDQFVHAVLETTRAPKQQGKTIIQRIIEAQSGEVEEAPKVAAAPLSTSGFGAASDGQASAPALSTSGFGAASDGGSAAPALSTSGFGAASDGGAQAVAAVSTEGFGAASDGGSSAAPALSTSGFGAASDGEAAAATASLSTSGFGTASDGQTSTTGFATASDGGAEVASQTGFAPAADQAGSQDGFVAAADQSEEVQFTAPEPIVEPEVEVLAIGAATVSSFQPVDETAGSSDLNVIASTDASLQPVTAQSIAEQAQPLLEPLIEEVVQEQASQSSAAGLQALAEYQQQQLQAQISAAGNYQQQSRYEVPRQQQAFARTPRVVKKLVPGPKISFPEGSVPVQATMGYQIAVPQGYTAYQAPDGTMFLMRNP